MYRYHTIVGWTVGGIMHSDRLMLILSLLALEMQLPLTMMKRKRKERIFFA